MRIGNIPTFNKEFSLHTREWERTARLGLEQVVNDNRALSVESGKYGAIITTYTTTNLFYAIMFTSEAYTLQDTTIIDGQIITSCESVVK